MDLRRAGDGFFLPPVPANTANSSIMVITGGRGVGKTTFCLKAIESYRQAGLNVCGFLTPGRVKNNQRNGILALDLASQESLLAASAIPGEIDGVRFGAWTFDSRVFEWGNQRLIQIKKPDVLVIDELGYLEFDLNFGWKASFEVLRKKEYRLALVVIRPECIEAFSALGFVFQTREVRRSV